MTDGMELPNPDKIRTHEEEETYKYFWILEADTIKQVQMKDKIRKEYPMQNKETTWDKTLQQKPHQRNKYLGCVARYIFGTLPQVDKRRTKTNGSKNKETNGHA